MLFGGKTFFPNFLDNFFDNLRHFQKIFAVVSELQQKSRKNVENCRKNSRQIEGKKAKKKPLTPTFRKTKCAR